MMILHDGHGKFLEIEMTGKNGVAWEADFFELSSNSGDILGDDPFFDQLKDPYKTTWRAAGMIHFVDDVEYCLQQAEDCKNGVGDFYDCGADPDTDINASIYDFNEVVI